MTVTALTITAARAEVLRAAADEQLHRYRGWGKGEKTADRIGGRSGRNVTRTCNDLADADPRMLRPGRTLGPSVYSPQVWELTDAGRKALADYDATERK